MYNVIYIGNNAKGCDAIHCHEDYNVVAAICQIKSVNDDLLTCCYLRDIPLIEIINHAALQTELDERAGSFDFAIMFSFCIMIKPSILSKHTIYNVHMSFLPFFKGRNSTFYATMAGEKTIGASLHKVVPGVDEGAIISRKPVPYYYWMSDLILWENLIQLIPLLLDDLNQYLNNPDFKFITNNSDHYHPPVTDVSTYITEDMPVKDMLNLVRSQEKHKGAKFLFNQETYFIMKAKISSLKILSDSQPDINMENKIVLKGKEPIGIKIDERYFLNFTSVSK